MIVATRIATECGLTEVISWNESNMVGEKKWITDTVYPQLNK
jgi:hypothetical protein